MPKRRRGSEKWGPLYGGHDLADGEEVLWSSNKRADLRDSLGQVVLTNRRLMFEPLRMIGTMRGRRWEVALDQIEGVEVVPKPKRPWPTRDSLLVSRSGGNDEKFKFAGDGIVAMLGSGAALQEACDEISKAVSAVQTRQG